MSDIENMESKVDELVSQGDTEQASQVLIELIEKCIQAKQIGKAESLREKLMDDVDPMALNEIVRLGDMIEDAKSSGVDQDFVSKWDRLLSTFTTEETNALFYELKPVDIPAQTVIYKANQIHPKLYFINSGEIGETFEQQDQSHEIVIHKQGNIAADHPFFNITITTTQLKVLKDANVSVLERPSFDKLLQTFPGLENKLKDFCLKQDQIPDLLKKQTIDRRACGRFNITGRTVVAILDKSGQPTGKEFNANLADISQGGLAVFYKTPQKKGAHEIFGRRVSATLILEKEGKRYKLERTGIVVAVTFYMSNEYIVHIRFSKPIGEKTVAEIGELLKDDSGLLM